MIDTTPLITLYTTPNCPTCTALKDWLSGMGLTFSEQRLFDTQGTSLPGPLAVIDGRIISGPIAEQKRAIVDVLTLAALG